jgi:hypothetical protein
MQQPLPLRLSLRIREQYGFENPGFFKKPGFWLNKTQHNGVSSDETNG